VGEGHDLQDVVEGEGGEDVGVDDHFLGGEGELVHVQGVGQGASTAAGGKCMGRRRRRAGLLPGIIKRGRRGWGVRHVAFGRGAGKATWRGLA